MADTGTTQDRRLAGYCPMGCGSTLWVDHTGRVYCSGADCPDPTAVTDLLADRETEHLVRFTAESFFVVHPLRCRIEGHLSRGSCTIQALIARADGPLGRGLYRVRLTGDIPLLDFEPVEEPGE